MLGSVAAAVVLFGAGYAALFGSSDGGRARSIGKITDAAATRPRAAVVSRETTASLPARDPANNPGGVSTAGDVEGASGVRVTRGSGGQAPGSLIIRMDDALGKLAPAPDPRLAERVKLGVLPRIGPDGARPAQVYARPFRPDPDKAALPKIAIMVGGLGLSAASTRDALDKLPPAVTFAFAPYGTSLEADVAKAREGGHEAVLQIPMEPIDSARNDPGPHTLQMAASASELEGDLQWLLTRFPGYFAVSPFLGGRFLQSADALAPVLGEIGKRGLALVEDGTPARSVLGTTARDLGLTTIGGATRLDADGDKGFDAALLRLEATARKDGFAFGTASALPATIDKLAKFLTSLETRGVTLVPVSASPVRAVPVAGGGDTRR